MERMTAEEYNAYIKNNQGTRRGRGTRLAKVAPPDERPNQGDLPGSVSGVVPGMPVSINAAYANKRPGTKGKGKTKTPEARAYQRDVRDSLACKRIAPAKWYRLEIILEADLLTNDRMNVRSLDVSNYIKLTEDAITQALGFDDKHIRRVEAEKRQMGPEGPRVWFVVSAYDS